MNDYVNIRHVGVKYFVCLVCIDARFERLSFSSKFLLDF